VADPAPALDGRKVLLGVAGGISAYKTPELVRQLVQRGADVEVVMTAAARRFVAPLALQVVSGHPVLTDLFELSEGAEVKHVALARAADLAVLAPATANLLGKLVSWNYRLVGPEEGFLAEGYSGVGRMSEPEAIAAALVEMAADWADGIQRAFLGR
jgi:phosphopantothenoylcysteine synthetase/decarboxylase